MRRPRKERALKKLRKNPAVGLLLPEEMFDATANTVVIAALHGASFNERLLIAAVIPSLLKVLRTFPARSIEEYEFSVHLPQPEGSIPESGKTPVPEQPTPKGRRRSK